jgi:hypothetical protein
VDDVFDLASKSFVRIQGLGVGISGILIKASFPQRARSYQHLAGKRFVGLPLAVYLDLLQEILLASTHARHARTHATHATHTRCQYSH